MLRGVEVVATQVFAGRLQPAPLRNQVSDIGHDEVGRDVELELTFHIRVRHPAIVP